MNQLEAIKTHLEELEIQVIRYFVDVAKRCELQHFAWQTNQPLNVDAYDCEEISVNTLRRCVGGFG